MGVRITQMVAFTDRPFPGNAVAVSIPAETELAHCCLALYWPGSLGKGDFIAYEASARGGVVCAQLQGTRLTLGGQTVTVLRGEMV